MSPSDAEKPNPPAPPNNADSNPNATEARSNPAAEAAARMTNEKTPAGSIKGEASRNAVGDLRSPYPAGYVPAGSPALGRRISAATNSGRKSTRHTSVV